MHFALKTASIEERLRAGLKIAFGNCWRWTGARNPNGYGVLRVDGKLDRVHRIAYRLWRGEIPEGLEINHKCYVRDCVNPDHLEFVTHAENIQKRSHRPYKLEPEPRTTRNHCLHGHEFTKENTILFKKKYRACRVCHNENIYKRRKEKGI